MTKDRLLYIKLSNILLLNQDEKAYISKLAVFSSVYIFNPFALRTVAGGAGGCSIYPEMTRGSQS